MLNECLVYRYAGYFVTSQVKELYQQHHFIFKQEQKQIILFSNKWRSVLNVHTSAS